MIFIKHNSIPTRIIVLAWTFFIAQLTACFPNLGYEYVYPTSVPSRSIADATLPFHEKWRVSNIIIPYRDVSNIYIYDNRLFFVNYKDDGITHWLEVLDAESGSFLWRTQDLPFSDNSLTADQQRLYLALAGKILAYNISTGDLLWETHEPLLGHTRYLVYSTKDELLVYSEEDISLNNREQIIRSYSLHDGLQLKTKRNAIPHNNILLLRTNSYDYWTDGNALWSTNVANEKLWYIKIRNRIQYLPVLTGDRLIFATGIFSEITGLDNASGQQVWNYNEKIVSNIAVDDGNLYAIKSDATIIAINAMTGNEIGYIELAPSVTETNSRSIAYLVAATGDMLFVYYGDSQELIAFSR